MSSSQEVLTSSDLTNIVFSFLDIVTKYEAGILPSEHEIPETPTEWRKPFAELALVNRAFFHASTSVLWETMVSLKPFLDLLRPANDTTAQSLGYARGIPSSRWDRFEFYSSRTKILVLTDEDCQTIDQSWIQCLSMSSERHEPLFPAIEDLFLMSYCNFALFAAFSVLPNLKSLHVDFGSEFIFMPSEGATTEGPCISLAAAASDQARHLVTLNVTHPATFKMTTAISTIRTLTRLKIQLSNEATVEQLKCLDQLKVLKRLTIEHKYHPKGIEDNFQYPSPAGLAAPTFRPSSLTNLRSLVVLGSGKAQFLTAATLSPQFLERLTVELVNHGNDCRNIALIPFAIAIHTQRNCRLKWLMVKWHNHRHRYNPADSGALGGNVEYTNPERLLTGLSSLKTITALSFLRTPFFSVDIISQILEVIPSLQQLDVLQLLPISATKDPLVLPSLTALEGIAKSNPRLRKLAIVLDTSQIPPVPKDFSSSHRLQILAALSFAPEYIHETTVSFSQDETFALGRYLDRLFPELDSVTKGLVPDERGPWVGVEKVMRTCQEVRAQTIADNKYHG